MEYENQKFPSSPNVQNNSINLYEGFIMISSIILISIFSNTCYFCIDKCKKYRFIHSNSIKFTNDINLIDDCCICLETYINNDKICKLKCSHTYHKKCIIKWMKHSNLCPLCKDEIL